MARISAYLLLSILLFSNLPLGQLCKFPVLLQHFKEHQQRNPGISFITFLSMHYGGDDMNDDDDERDRQLPFKSESILYSAYYLSIHKIQLRLPAAPDVTAHVNINETFHLSGYSGSLFHPPKYPA